MTACFVTRASKHITADDCANRLLLIVIHLSAATSKAVIFEPEKKREREKDAAKLVLFSSHFDILQLVTVLEDLFFSKLSAALEPVTHR